jgi:hypothetical protein
MTTYTANDLYDMFANQSTPVAIIATSIEALALDIEELDNDASIDDYEDAAADVRNIAFQNLAAAVLAESEYGDPYNSLIDWLAAGEYSGNETAEQIAAEWDSDRDN